MSIIITGASGHLGRRTAELVLERAPASEVVLTTRRPETLAELAARGAEVRIADFDRPETLAEAFAGGERLLLISTDAVGRRVHQHLAAIDAAARAGVRHVDYTSGMNPVEQNPPS
jgi:NAD(P)H dehydrogenase (quinone)